MRKRDLRRELRGAQDRETHWYRVAEGWKFHVVRLDDMYVEALAEATSLAESLDDARDLIRMQANEVMALQDELSRTKRAQVDLQIKAARHQREEH